MEKSKDEILRQLGNPILLEPSENFYRVRRNCLVGSSIISLVLYLVFTSASDHKGLELQLPFIKLENIPLDSLFTPLLLLQGYLCIHFAILSIMHFMEIRIHITGTFKPYGYVSESGVQDGNPYTPKETSRFSSLYNWWTDQASNAFDFDGNEARIKRMDEGMQEFYNRHKDELNFANCHSALKDIRKDSSEALNHSRTIHEMLTKYAPTILPRLERFYRWAHEYRKIQLFDLFLIEILLPIALAAVSTFFIFNLKYHFL
jgi:hypothetical protein